MTFYQELQLSSAGSKQLIKNTKDAKEKKQRFRIYQIDLWQ
jgi:anti-anti-sigma regulatory factor